MLLQVLRLRDPPSAPACAGRGDRAARRRRAPAGQGAAGPHGRGARPSPRGTRAPGRVGLRRTSRPTSCGRVERALERGLLPHTNLGVLSPRRPRAAARGHRLAGADARVGQPRPRRPPGLADQAPGQAACRRSAPRASCGSRSRAGSSSASASPRRTAWPRSRRSPRCTPSTATCRRSSCRTSSRTAATTARSRPRSRPRRPSDFWRTGLSDAPHRDLPAWATPVGIEDMKRLVAETRRLMPDVGVQVPPNLADWWPELVAAGRHRPRRAERQRRPHLARAPVPVAAPGAQAAGAGRRGADRAAVRLRALHRPGVGRPGRARRHQDEVLELHPAPRLGAHRGARDPHRPRRRRRSRAGATASA